MIAGPVTSATPPGVLRHAAHTCVLRALSALMAGLPVAAAIDRVLFLRGFINSAPDFTGHSLVMDEASNLLRELFGESGRHARSALGVAGLPDGGVGWVTVHPSYLLRLPDRAQAEEEYARFVEDLKGAQALLG